jgi:hypothetical protein
MPLSRERVAELVLALPPEQQGLAASLALRVYGTAPRGSKSEREEVIRCEASPAYFITNYVQIYDATAREWIRFDLWLEQLETLSVVDENQQVVILKARQLGLTWLLLGYALWLMLFRPIATVLIFSLRETEAVYLLGKDRLRGMYDRLPVWLRSPVAIDAAKHLALENGSSARAFPTSAGDSYTATLALVDEADLVPDLGQLLGRVKPTIDAGGKLVLLSRSNKRAPQSEFKKIYRAAKQKATRWVSVFLPWHVRPSRTAAWYEQERADTLRNTGALDDLHEQYPASDAEALAPASLDKRLPAAWLDACYDEGEPLEPGDAPSIPGLIVYRPPERGHSYVIGVDPAEGLPGGDDTSIHVVDRKSGEEVAMLAGKLEPKRVTPETVADLGVWYNAADVLVERNNHGHAVIAGLEADGRLEVLDGRDERPGWAESKLAKTILYDNAADAIKNRECRVHSFSTYVELSSVERNTLSAPKGEHDDEAVSFALALMARTLEEPVPHLAEAGGEREDLDLVGSPW